jgi:hypothetical protein
VRRGVHRGVDAVWDQRLFHLSVSAAAAAIQIILRDWWSHRGAAGQAAWTESASRTR